MRTLLLLLVLTLPLFANAPAGAAEPLKISGATMGTYYSIVIDSPPGALGKGDDLQADIEERLKQINAQMSTWDDASEISRFNKSTSTDWIEVSAEFALVVTEALKVHRLSNGAFDPTVAPLIDLWGFGDRRKKTVPDEAAIKATQATIGMQHLEVRLKPPALRKAIAELQLNLSAIAKGYGVDAISELLSDRGLASFVADIGGENRVGTSKASGDPWRLGVESPLGGLHRVMKLTESSIATSGDYRNFFEMDGAVYSHAIDPITGWPVKNPPASVSVIHPSSMTADAWATAMMVLGTERGQQIAEANKLSVMFQTVSSDQTISETSTGLFATKVESTPESASSEESIESQVRPEKVAERSPWFPFIAAAIIFLIAIGGMAIGTILQNKSIKGSCGGLASIPGSEGKSICELCTIPKDQCTNADLREQMQKAAECSDDAC